MQLILRNLVACLTATILATLVLTGGAMVWREREDLAARQAKALRDGRSLIATTLLPAASKGTDQEQIEGIIRLFDDSPILAAHLVDPWGFDRFQSTPSRLVMPLPEWFRALLAPRREEIHIDFGQIGSLHLQPYPPPAIAEIWRRTLAILAILASGLVLAASVTTFLAYRALRTLAELEQASLRMQSGDTRLRVSDTAPGISQAFNRLATTLEDTIKQNARLTRMIDRLQEEERSDLARNLHDDIGPQLLAVDVDASTIIRQSEQPEPDLPGIAERAKAIRTSTTTMKRHVRQLLGQLRPNEALKLGLEPAVRNLADYWRERRPELRFGIRIDPEPHGAMLEGTLHAVIREAVANAVKHGHPRYIDISVDSSATELRLRISDDGGGADDFAGPGYGVIGMRERVQSVGGRFIIDRRVDVPGVVVAAILPIGHDGRQQIGA